jgi:hypothetical protein
VENRINEKVCKDYYCKEAKRFYPPHVWRVYVNRTFSGNRYHRRIDGDIDAGAAAGQGTGKRDDL